MTRLRPSNGADCECRPTGRWVEPVNTASSLAYVAAGAVLAAVARRRAPRLRSAGLLAASVALEGVGSVAFHGGTPGGQGLHDLPLMALSGHVAGWHLGRLVGGDGGAGTGAVAGGLGAVALGGAGWWREPAVVNPVVGAGAVVTGLAEVAARRRGMAPVWTPVLTGLLAASALTWWAGRGDGPRCRPASPWQPHALWHLGTAAVLAGWGLRVGGVERAHAATGRATPA